MDRGSISSPWSVAFAIGSLVVLVYTGAAMQLAAASSHFIGDDLVGFWWATHKPFLPYLALPLDIHLAPLHRLTTWVVRTLAPMNFWVGLSVLASFHLAGVTLLYLTLQRFRATPYNWLLVGLYGTHVYLPCLFIWWTSGLHRLPCIAFSFGAVYAYVRFRNGGHWGWAVVMAVSELCAFGFFIKAILVPLLLVGIEWCLRRDTTAAEKRRNAVALGVAGLVGVAYPAIWFELATKPARMLALDLPFQWSCQKTTWRVLLESTLGFLHGGWLPFALAVVVWAFAVFVTLRMARPSTDAWTFVVVGVSASALVTCLPFSRFVIFGGNVVDRVHRYYFELMGPLVLFTALAFRRFSAEAVRARLGRFRTAFRVAVAGLLVVAASHSFANARKLLAGPQYADFVKQHRFITRLQEYLTDLRAEGVTEPSLVDSELPVYVLGWLNQWRRASTLFEAMGVPAHFSPKGFYRVTVDGAIVEVGK